MVDAVALEDVDPRVVEGENNGAAGLTCDVQLSPTEIDALARLGEQNLRDLRYKGGLVDVVVAVVAGHAILPCLRRRRMRRRDLRSVTHAAALRETWLRNAISLDPGMEQHADRIGRIGVDRIPQTPHRGRVGRGAGPV